MPEHLSAIDLVVLIAYLLGTLAMGFALSRRVHTGQDYFLAGRRLPWWAVGMSLVATDIGATDMIGVGGQAYAYGMAIANFEWIGCIPAMLLAAFVFVPFFWRSGVATIPEFVERRFHVGVRTAMAVCWFVMMACNLGIMLFGSTKMMTALFGLGLDEWGAVCLLATAVLVGVYTLSGGLAAVVYTDVIQCVVMIGGCLLMLIMGLVELGGIEPLLESLHRRGQESHTHLVLPVETQSPYPWSGILFGLALVLGPAYWIGNQAIVQRALGTRSVFEAQAAYVTGALLKNLIPLIIAVPGLVALALMPELDEADQALPTLTARVLPAGLRGLFLAAFLAALMSSVDSYLNAASTIVTTDFYQRFINREASGERILRVGRITTFVLLIWGIVFGLMLFQTNQGIYTVFQTLMSFMQGPTLAVLGAGILWRRANGTGALVGFVAGVLTAVGLFSLHQLISFEVLAMEPLFQIQEPFLYYSVWSFLVALGLLVVVSLLTRPEPDEKIAGLVYQFGKRAT